MRKPKKAGFNPIVRTPYWFRLWIGHRKTLPGSERQGKIVAREQLAPVLAQIAVFFGLTEPELDTFRAAVLKLSKGEQIICQSCGRDIWTERHHEQCQIIEQARRVFAGPATAQEELDSNK